MVTWWISSRDIPRCFPAISSERPCSMQASSYDQYVDSVRERRLVYDERPLLSPNTILTMAQQPVCWP